MTRDLRAGKSRIRFIDLRQLSLYNASKYRISLKINVRKQEDLWEILDSFTYYLNLARNRTFLWMI